MSFSNPEEGSPFPRSIFLGGVVGLITSAVVGDAPVSKIGRTLEMDWQSRIDLTQSPILGPNGIAIPEDRSAPDWPPEAWPKVGVLAVKFSAINYSRHGYAFINPQGRVVLGTAPGGRGFGSLPGDDARLGFRVRVGNEPHRGIAVGLREPLDDQGRLTPDPLPTELITVTTADDPEWHGAVLLV